MLTITQLQRLMIYDTMLIICLILSGYTLGLKIYTLSFMFIAIAFLSHSRLVRMLELKEENTLEGLEWNVLIV